MGQEKYNSLLSRKAQNNNDIQKRMKQLKQNQENGIEEQLQDEQKRLEQEYDLVERQIQEQRSQKDNVEEQNKRLQAEIEEVSKTMEELFGEDILRKGMGGGKQIDYKNIKQENVREKVERERQQKKEQDKYKDIKDELAEINAQCKDYQQRIQKIKQNDNQNTNRQQVVQLMNQNKQQLDDNKVLKRNLDLVTKQNDIVTKEINQVMQSMGYETKLQQWKDDRQSYRDKIKIQVLQKNQQDKKLQQQQDELGWLQKNYKEVCKKAKVNDCLDLEKAKELDQKQQEDQQRMDQYKQMHKGLFKNKQAIQQNVNEKQRNIQKIRGRQYQQGSNSSQGKVNGKQNVNGNEEEHNVEIEQIMERLKDMNENNMKLLKQELKDTKAEYDYKRGQTNQLTEINTNTIRQLEFEKKDLLNRLKEKEKEANIQMSKLNEIKRTAKTSPLLEKGLALENDISKNSHANLQYLKGILVESKRRHTKREAVGSISLGTIGLHKNMMVFDDQFILNDGMIGQTRMTRIRLFTLKHNIVGIQASYMVDNKVVEGMANINSHHLSTLDSINKDPSQLEVARDHSQLEVLTLDINQGDFLRFISGVSGDVIEFLKLETNLGKRIQSGKMETGKGRKEFHLELKKESQVVTIFGGLDYRRQATVHHDTQLAFLGVETLLTTYHLKKGGQLTKFNN